MQKLFTQSFSQAVFVKFCSNYKSIFISENLRKKACISIHLKGTKFDRCRGFGVIREI